MPPILSHPPARTARSTVLLLTFAAVALSLTGCSGTTVGAETKGASRRGDMAVPVTVARAVQKDVPVDVDVIGSIEPYSSVTLKSQISGQLMAVHFQEGDIVRSGQLLFTIDSRAIEAQIHQTDANIARDEAQLGQMQANLARDKAQETNLKAQFNRAAELWRGGIIAQEQYDQADAALQSQSAVIRADQAAIENARAQVAASQAALESQKVQLSYTKIYAPLPGRTGAILSKPGNIVTADNTELALINQVQPVFVTFAVPETYLSQLRATGGHGLEVRVKAEEGGAEELGTVAFLDNAVDTSTGTIRLKATLPNSDRTLWPGQFVRVTLRLANRPNAVVVPSQAIQTGQDGTFVYVVSSDRKVAVRPVVIGERLDQETVVDRGVSIGDTVVTEGALRLVPGARVQVREPGGSGGQRDARKAS